MERPLEKNRWDKPLFSILPEDELDFEGIYKHLFENFKEVKVSRMAKCKVKLGNDYSYKTDQILVGIVRKCRERLVENRKFLGEKFVVVRVGERSVRLRTGLGVNCLKKWKNEFVAMNKLNPFETVEAIEEAFVYFLNNKVN